MRKLILILVVALGSIGPLSAGVLTYTIAPNGGQFSYQFTLTNTGVPSGPVFDLFLSLPTDIANIDTAAIGTPVGWGDPTGGFVIFGLDTSPTTSFIDWSADFSGTYDLGIGDSLGGFSFLSPLRIDPPITFALNGTTDFATAQEVSSVPEPASFLLLLPVIAGLIAFRIRSRSVQTP